MESQSKMSNGQIRYQACVRSSPILFTAPHSKTLRRGKPQQKIANHERQSFTSFLAVQFARATNNSFIVWKATKQVHPNDFDPNYLLKQDFPKNPFHQSLHFWALKSKNIPLLNINLHGKRNRENNCNIDVGFLSMEVHWKKDPLVNQIRSFFTKNADRFDEYKFGKFKMVFETNPVLHGYWGSKIHTLNEQAILLGIPSLQLMIPLDVRIKLFKDQIFRGKFTTFIEEFYKAVIVPDYKWREGKYRVEEGVAKIFKPNVSQDKDQQQILSEIIKFQSQEKISI